MDLFDKAIPDCTKVMELDPDHAGVYTARGDAYRKLDDVDAALADYNRALELNPKDSASFNNRALLHRDMDNDDLAVQDYNRALDVFDAEYDYDIHVIWHNRGMVYADLGEYDKAIFDFRTAIDTYPTYVRAIMSLGSLFYTLERYPQSLELYETVIRLEESGVQETIWDTSYIPDTIETLRELIAEREAAVGEHIGILTAAREAHIREDYATAIESYTELIDLVPEYYHAYYWRAQALEEVNQYDDALKDYQAYYDRASSEDDYYYTASYRIEDLELLVSYDPDAVELYLEASDTEYEDPEKALDLYSQAIALDSSFAKVYLQRAFLNQYTLFDWEAALADYESYVALADMPTLYRYEILQLQAKVELPDDAQACLRDIDNYYYNYDSELTTDELIALYSCVIELAPNYAPAYADRGGEYEYAYRYVEAVADYKMYIRLIDADAELSAIFDAINDDDFYDTYYDEYGYYDDDIYYDSPEYIQSSLDRLLQYAELPSEVLEEWQNAERVYYTDTESLVAIGHLDQVISLQPEFAEAYSLRGRIYYYDGDYDHALTDLKAYIALEDDDAMSNYEQGLITEIETLFALPSEVQDLYKQAMLEADNYEYATAIDIYTQVIDTYPDIADAYFERGQLYYYEGDYALGLADLNHYISMVGDDNPHVDDLEWMLDYLKESLEAEDSIEED